MDSLRPIDSFKSFQVAKAVIENGVKTGALSPQKAKEYLGDARKNYSSNAYNREIEKHKRK